MVQNMERLDETVKEEADGVHNTLGTTQLPSLRPGKTFKTLADLFIIFERSVYLSSDPRSVLAVSYLKN